MAYIVYKKVGKRRYAYLQRSYRTGKRVRTKSQYLGPVAVALAIFGGVALANPPGRKRAAKSKFNYRESDTDARRRKMGTGKTLEQEAWELHGKDYRAMRPRDQAIRDAWQRKASTMSREEWDRHMAWAKTQLSDEKAAASSDAPQPQASQSDEAPDD